MNKLIISFVVMLLALNLVVGIASAHVTVQPEETTQGSYETFTVKVPTESDEIPTTKVEVLFPSSVIISGFEPKPGWKYEIKRDNSDKITSVTWIAENEGLLPMEFGLFHMQGRVADDATEIVWKAYQTYQDGTIVEWIGAGDSQKPASVTTILPATESSGNHHNSAEKTSEVKEEARETTNNPLYFSIPALILALLAIGISITKRS
ncbi:DUF1775 domain-containing protein [Lysinibacillus yapensis]|uniref:DUF1775 domain-containing protein n=1 Tax=Ureibacillus yapensis TaxID=2304605 RepID=A0A396S2I8_9BACL|nr:YcnI family protein [Lysinibacillus yapensis]RHW30947.1 DUF1775 domain-containing protein [Lysinibacillus yapensis]